MTVRNRIALMLTATLCATLLIGTVGIAYHGPAVRFEVTLAVIAQWAAALKVASDMTKTPDSRAGDRGKP